MLDSVQKRGLNVSGSIKIHALRCTCIDWIAKATEVRAVLIGLLDHGEQVVDGAGRAVEAQDYQDLAASPTAATKHSSFARRG